MQRSLSKQGYQHLIDPKQLTGNKLGRQILIKEE